mmetsp:Transcript_5378/g.11409  ORF Transcript_5378/g.11409 Transcript_5378/m.11409 type:complete len:229 (+) Transcript_5378:1437-2123(+)
MESLLPLSMVLRRLAHHWNLPQQHTHPMQRCTPMQQQSKLRQWLLLFLVLQMPQERRHLTMTCVASKHHNKWQRRNVFFSLLFISPVDPRLLDHWEEPSSHPKSWTNCCKYLPKNDSSSLLEPTSNGRVPNPTNPVKMSLYGRIATLFCTRKPLTPILSRQLLHSSCCGENLRQAPRVWIRYPCGLLIATTLLKAPCLIRTSYSDCSGGSSPNKAGNLRPDPCLAESI